MNKENLIKQHVSVNSFANQSIKVHVIRYMSLFSASMGICILFVVLMELPIMLGVGIALAMSSGGLWAVSQSLEDSINTWVENLSTVRIESSKEQRGEESAEVAKKESRGDVDSTEINYMCVYELVQASNSGESKLLRRHLTSKNWDNLSRKWNDKTILRTAFRCGITDTKGHFLIGPAVPSADGARKGTKGPHSGPVGGSR